MSILATFYNRLFLGCKVETLHFGDFTLLPKKSPHGVVANGRPLSNLSVIWKLFSMVITKVLQTWLTDHNRMSRAQMAMQCSTSVVDLLRIVFDRTQQRWWNGLWTFLLMDDVVHVFGSVSHDILRSSLLSAGVHPSLTELVPYAVRHLTLHMAPRGSPLSGHVRGGHGPRRPHFSPPLLLSERNQGTASPAISWLDRHPWWTFEEFRLDRWLFVDWHVAQRHPAGCFPSTHGLQPGKSLLGFYENHRVRHCFMGQGSHLWPSTHPLFGYAPTHTGRGVVHSTPRQAHPMSSTDRTPGSSWKPTVEQLRLFLWAPCPPIIRYTCITPSLAAFRGGVLQCANPYVVQCDWPTCQWPPFCATF